MLSTQREPSDHAGGRIAGVAHGQNPSTTRVSQATTAHWPRTHEQGVGLTVRKMGLGFLGVYARVNAVTVVGVRGHPVVVQAHVGRGLPALYLTGLPGAAV